MAAGRLRGRVVLVTGGNGGIGLGMAQACGQEGAAIVIWGRQRDKNYVALEELAGLGVVAHAFVCDVTDPTAVERTFAASVDVAGGRIDSVFANAGTTGQGACRSSTSSSRSGIESCAPTSMGRS